MTFTPDGLAVHAFLSFAGIRQARPRRAHSGIITSTSRDGVTWNVQVPVIELFNSVEPHEDKPWINRASSSLPVPKSPQIKMGTLLMATVVSFASSALIACD